MNNIPADKKRIPHASLSKELGYANQPKDIDWVSKNIPCQESCPAKTRIPEYIDAVSQGEYEKAYKINLEDNVFPAVLGRVCARPCEEDCRHGREGLGESVAICFSKRSASDLKSSDLVVLEKIYGDTGKKIGIIGGGPAGLAAARELALYGHNCTVYEKYSEPGGMLNQGIPEFRLPRDLIRKEIDQIKALGVDIKCNVDIGKEVTIEELRNKYDAVILAAGTLDPNHINIPGKELIGIRHGLDFLLEANETGQANIGKRVIVIGGGFTAMDCARSAIRLGSETSIYYRRSMEEMPVTKEEVEEVIHEKIPIELMVSPIEYIGENGVISSIKFVRNELGEADSSGRRRPVPIEGSQVEVEVDTVLLATGQNQDTSWIDKGLNGNLVDDRGWVKSGENNLTELSDVFIAGDYALGASTIIDAVGHAKECAIAVDAYLMGEVRIEEVVEIENFFETGRIPKMDEIPRQPMPMIALDERSWSAEVETGYKFKGATTESQRCYLCHYKFEIDNDICIYCEKCLDVKPMEKCIVRIDALQYAEDGKIVSYTDAFDPTPEKYNLLYIDQDECIRCGECEKVCPVECISIQKVSRKNIACCN
jgi:formate dehydrogenase major subunit